MKRTECLNLLAYLNKRLIIVIRGQRKVLTYMTLRSVHLLFWFQPEFLESLFTKSNLSEGSEMF